MNELADRNQGGRASPEEHDELMSYIKAGHLLALLHSHEENSQETASSRRPWLGIRSPRSAPTLVAARRGELR
jgi:hypothetical protein